MLHRVGVGLRGDIRALFLLSLRQFGDEDALDPVVDDVICRWRAD